MLAIRKVILYKHGVGYFERRGTVSGDEAVDLHFKASEMNDVLKSLTVLDLGGGLVSSISYESTKPLEKQLEDIAIRLPDDSSLTGLLAQVKGTPVRVEVGSRTVDGLVAGIETVARRADGETTWTRHLSLVVDGASVEVFPLLELKRLTFLDETLRKDLQHLLATLIASKKKDLKRLTIFARGEGERPIVASYLVETPVWKTSYRILLGPGQPLVQGWALVDNTGDEDWQDAELTLVAGLPVSFVHDLYSPRYKRRPRLEVHEEEAYAPPVLEDAVELRESDFDTSPGVVPSASPTPMARDLPPRFSPAAMRPQASPLGKAAVPPRARAEARKESVRVEARTAEVGDLFEYSIQNAVTVKRNQSALVPILQAHFEGRRVAIYNPEVRAKNPMSAVLFKNTTGMTLEGGPVTVLEGESYVGESMLETLKPDEQRLVPFSVELGCTVTVDGESEVQDVHHARLVGGTLAVERYRIDRAVYLVRNKLDREIDLFLDHPITEDHRLVETPEPAEKTERFYRFRLVAKPRATTKFEVREKSDVHESWSVLTANRGTVGLWLKRKYIDEATRDALFRLLEMHEKLASLDYWIAEREKEIESIFRDQERLRENLARLGTSGDERGLRERYVAALSEEEDRIAAMRGEIQSWKSERSVVDADVKALVSSLRFER